jgi:hypothetical protein
MEFTCELHAGFFRDSASYRARRFARSRFRLPGGLYRNCQSIFRLVPAGARTHIQDMRGICHRLQDRSRDPGVRLPGLRVGPAYSS